MKKTLAITAALASSMALGAAAHAADNPFAATALSSGYQLAQADTKPMDDKGAGMKGAEMKPMDGKGDSMKKMDGSCSGKKNAGGKQHAGKKMDGSCSASKK